jgi:hypothetical protein
MKVILYFLLSISYITSLNHTFVNVLSISRDGMDDVIGYGSRRGKLVDR